jgi:mediator of RNA polymerase II transcription subunit 4
MDHHHNAKMTASTSLLQPLDNLQALSQTFFQSLSQPGVSLAVTPSEFTSTSESLASSISLARKHQTKQRRIDALMSEILTLDQAWRNICLQLKEGKDELAEIIEEGEQRMKGINEAKEGKQLLK